MPWLRAAVDAPFGALPYDQVLRIAPYSKDAAAAAFYAGDVLIKEADGALAVSAASSATMVGVAVGWTITSVADDAVLVYDHPDQLFTMQDDSDTTAMTASSRGLNADLVVTTGDTSTLRSLHEIDSSSAATTAGLAVKVMNLHPIETQSYAAAAGSPRKWIIRLNEHLYGGFEVAGI